jgi:hypothetical protein
MHKANITHGIVGVTAVLKPTSTGEAYETVNIIADYKPLEDKPTKLADIIYLNTTKLNTEMKLSQAITTIATVVDRISNNYEKSSNETLKLQAKAYKTIAAQLRTITSYFESKLREYNNNVKTITTLVTDQEEELFIDWCSACIWVCSLICWLLITLVIHPCHVCHIFVNPILIIICYIICELIIHYGCEKGCGYICGAAGFC